MQEPFRSVPLIWLIQEDILGKRISHYTEWGWEDLINEWRSAFSRADVMVFPDYSLPVKTQCSLFSMKSATIHFFLKI